MKVDDTKLLERMADVYRLHEGTTAESMSAALELLPELLASVEARVAFAQQVADEVASTLSRANLLTDEDLRLIREHVRPKDSGDAVELAVLKERIRCARLAQLIGETLLAKDILAGIGTGDVT
jgi:hypothetical protein